MGLFDKKFIVEYEYSDGFFSSYKKATVEIDASSDHDAERKAKSILKYQHKFIRNVKARKS